MKLVFDLAALISRVTIGVIFVAHGWQKLTTGLGPTSLLFTKAGVPLPELAAAFTMTAETLGGVALIIGVLTRVAALALLVVSVGAIVFVHAGNGIFVAANGWELAGALSAACLLLVALGGGRISVDGIVRSMFAKRAESRAAEEEMASVTTAGAAPTVTAAPTQAAREAPTQAMPAPPTQAVPAPPGQAAPQEPRPAAPEQPRRQSPPPSASGMSDEDRKALDDLLAEDERKKNPPTGG